MKITVINGNMRHGSTWHCMDQVRQELLKYDELEMTEFFLPKDLPHFCNGCFTCFYHGENKCPHAESVAPIVKAMTEADLIVLTSPVYGLDVSGQMKALIDHLCFMWISHRPKAELFDKVGLTITTTAGAGLGHATKTMRNSLKFWGVKKLFSFKNPVSASKWEDVTEKKLKRITKDTALLAKKIYKSVKNSKKLPNPMFRTIMFRLMTGMQKKNDWNPTDRNHWESQGWLDGVKPF